MLIFSLPSERWLCLSDIFQHKNTHRWANAWVWLRCTPSFPLHNCIFSKTSRRQGLLLGSPCSRGPLFLFGICVRDLIIHYLHKYAGVKLYSKHFFSPLLITPPPFSTWKSHSEFQEPLWYLFLQVSLSLFLESWMFWLEKLDRAVKRIKKMLNKNKKGKDE